MGKRGPLPNPMSERSRKRKSKDKRRFFGYDDVAGEIKPPEPVEPPLSLSPEARKFWDEHAPRLLESGLLTPLSSYPFAVTAQTYAMAVDLETQVRSEGFMLKGPRGREYPHPLLRASKSYWQVFLMYARDFGLTPASRERMPAPPRRRTAEDDDFD